MKSITELEHETDIDTLYQEIRARKELMKQMVGTLYPDVVTVEISRLHEIVFNLQRTQPKQVIVMRKDLNMRKGKMIAQGAHASMAVLLYMMSEEDYFLFDGYTPGTKYTLHATGDVRAWLQGKFTKVCVSVNSEQELLDVYAKAQYEGIACRLITDSGLTEFDGVPTNTCCAIGPYRREDIDKITGHLSLL